jgi:hypothetical protein
VVAPGACYITFVAEEFMTENYFNTRIIERHADHMYMNNSMAECYDFCLGVATVLENVVDQVWYSEQKKGHICYDV